MDILLIAGLWLPHTIWTDVVAELTGLGHRPLPVALPGVDDASATATLDDQLDTVLEAIDGADRPVVVGHSAACTLAWLAADRRPEAVGQVVFIGGFPAADGAMYADFFPSVDGLMAFPGWDPFEGADAADLNQAARDHIAAIAVPVAEGVSQGLVRLHDERRFDIPVLVVCPEFSPEQARTWIEEGDVPELERATRVAYADIDSGHWPMFTRARELAGILDAAATV